MSANFPVLADLSIAEQTTIRELFIRLANSPAWQAVVGVFDGSEQANWNDLYDPEQARDLGVISAAESDLLIYKEQHLFNRILDEDGRGNIRTFETVGNFHEVTGFERGATQYNLDD